MHFLQGVLRLKCSCIRLAIYLFPLTLSYGCAFGGQGVGTNSGTGRGGEATTIVQVNIKFPCLVLCTEIYNAGQVKQVPISIDQSNEIARLAYSRRPEVQESRILWVDDNPENNNGERNFLSQLGILVDLARSTSDGLVSIDTKAYDIVITDMVRGWDRNAGKSLFEGIKAKHKSLPTIFYTNKNYDMPDGAFGLTTRPDELVKLVLDALRNHRSPSEAQPGHQ
ncbi:MAG: response regulator [Nitrospira sp.]|nr:response regulator [Nitrospira sp.]